MRNVVFQTEYEIDMFYLDPLNEEVDTVTLANMHSTTLRERERKMRSSIGGLKSH